jgi:hypothetical protein
MLRVLGPHEQVMLRPMTNYEAAQLGGSYFGHSMATPDEILVNDNAPYKHMVSGGGPPYRPPLTLTFGDAADPLLLLAHELGHAGRLQGIGSFGEDQVIARVNGARRALGLPVRRGHTDMFIFPGPEVREADLSLFHNATRRP